MAKHYVLFAGSSLPKLAMRIADCLDISLGKATIETFPDQEIGVRIEEDVRGLDAFVLQSIAHHPNLYLMEMLIMMDALKRSSVRSIVPVIPYMGYARQDRRGEGRSAITAKLVAAMLERAGATQVVALDLHAEQMEGFFEIPLIHLHAHHLLARAAKRLRLERPVVVVPDGGRLRLGRTVAQRLEAELGFVDKRRIDAKRVKSSAVTADVLGRDVLLVDDICSTGATLKRAAEECKRAGAKRLVALLSHGPLNRGALEDSAIEKVITTNSVPLLCEKPMAGVEVVSIHTLLAGAIQEIVRS